AFEPVLPALVLAEHRVIALEDVLVGPAPRVMHAHRVVRRDRAVEEAPRLVARVLGAQPRKRGSIAPQLEGLVLARDEVRARWNGSEHGRLSYPRCRRPTKRCRGADLRSPPRSSRCSSRAWATPTSAPTAADSASLHHRS